MWHILNYIPRPGARRSRLPALFDAFNARPDVSAPLELFAPTFMRLVTADGGRVLKSERPLLYHYIFVRGSEADIKLLCSVEEGFSFVIDRAGPRRHLTVSDEALESFRIIAGYHAGQLPCFPLQGISLEEGDRVQVVSGPFAGLTGTYISRRGARSGSVMVAIDNGLAAAVFDVKADYVRVLEFARDSRRLYDQLDAFASRLQPFLSSSEESRKGASESLLAAAAVFTRRLGVVKVDAPKIEARLRILLYAAYSILSDRPSALPALERYRALEPHVTSASHRALAASILTLFPPPSASP